MSLRDEELSQTALISARFGSHLIISIRPPSEKTRGPKKGRANVEYLDVTHSGAAAASAAFLS